MLYLAHWARKLSWKETALSFGTTWDQVCHAVEYVVQWGLAHRELGTLRAIGVDEIHIGKSHKFLTLVYQETLPAVARDGAGHPLVSKEPVVLNTLPKRGSGKPSNVTLRGTGPTSLLLRPQVKVNEGRMFRPGSSEVIAARSIAAGFQGVNLGGTLRFGGRDWPVVGLSDAGKSGFD